jgi:hypothetical protein
MPRKILLLVVLVVTGLTSIVRAEVFPQRPGNADVIYTDNAFVDLYAKLWMINSAKRTIDISAFMFGKDHVGLTIVRALREALNRGVDVRVMYEGTVGRTLGQDLLLRVTDLLTDPSLRKQAQVINLGLFERLKSSYALNDSLHEKLFIVDKNTDNEIIYFGGRDLSDFSRITIDSGYFVRPIDPEAAYFGSDLKAYYESLWNLLVKNFTIENTTSIGSAEAALKSLSVIKPVNIKSENRAELQKILAIFQSKPIKGEVLAPFQFRPESAQVVTNSLLKNLFEERFADAPSLKESLMANDDILITLRQMIIRSQKVRVSSYSSDFAAPLLSTLRNFVQTPGKELTVYTNGFDAMSSMDPIGISEIAFDYSLVAMMDLERHKNGNEKGVSTYFLDRIKSSIVTHEQKTYLHRKLVLFDDKYVATGSYNFTESSSTKNDEFIVVFNDPRMNAHHQSLNMVEQASMYNKMPYNELYTKLFLLRNSIKRLVFGSFVKSQY